MSKSLPIIFIVGPTAGGKSEISFYLAQKINAEIIYCDSAVLYKEISVLSAKPPVEYRNAIPHHMIDMLSVNGEYNVCSYGKEAGEIIRRLTRRKKNIVVTGGSGLYVKALLDGIFEGAEKNQEIREKIEEEIRLQGLERVYARLQKVDPDAASHISANDKMRIIRALEVYENTGCPISQLQKQSRGIAHEYPCALFGIAVERTELYQRINRRTKAMFVQGAVEEVRRLLTMPLSQTARSILGIKEIAGYLEGGTTLAEAEEELAKNTRHFAKRQMTWFRKDKRVEWIEATGLGAEEIVENIYKKVVRKV